MRTIIIGDVHGCSGLLDLLLKKTAPQEKKDRLIFLGDLFDRGPDSWQIFQRVKELAAQFGEDFVLLRGNHEDYLLNPHLGFMERRLWDRVGRQATVKSFQLHQARMEDAKPFIESQVKLYYTGEGFQCVHAGIFVHPPLANDMITLVHDHDIVLQNRYTGPLTITGHIALPYPAWFAGDEKTVLELPYDTKAALPDHGVICIDTGAGKGGFLTGMVIENGFYYVTMAI